MHESRPSGQSVHALEPLRTKQCLCVTLRPRPLRFTYVPIRDRIFACITFACGTSACSFTLWPNACWTKACCDHCLRSHLLAVFFACEQYACGCYLLVRHLLVAAHRRGVAPRRPQNKFIFLNFGWLVFTS